MNESLPVTASLPATHRAALESANRWRGHCVECYARLEWGAHLTLGALPKVPGFRMPTVFGERLKRLTALFSETGQVPKPKIHEALAEIEPLLALRNMMVHAIGTVYIDAYGRWLWHYQFQPSKAGAPVDSGSILQGAAESLERDLQRKVQRICSLLKAERAKFEQPTT